MLVCIFANGQTAASYWKDVVAPQYSDTNFSSFSVTKIFRPTSPNSFQADLSLVKYQSGIYITTSHDNIESKHLIIKDDTVTLIENDYANITFDGGPDNKVCSYMTNVYALKLFTHLPLTKPVKVIFHGIHDTTVDNTNYHILNGTYLAGMIFNDETQEFDIPNYEYLRYWCNANTNLVEKIIVSDDSTTMIPHEIYEIKYPANNGNLQTLPEKYNIHSGIYSKYAVYDVTKGDPAPSVIGHGTDNTEMNDEILKFPLVRPNYDTLRLADTSGWKLLEFWTYGCKPCIAFLQSLSKEKDSLGYRVLEKNGISIFCIENNGGMTDKFKNYASKWKAEDVLYAARGMEFLRIKYTPYYYLYSPDNKLVYHGTTEHITDTLLYAKSTYEKRQQDAKKLIGARITMDKTVYDYGNIAEGSNGECIFWVKNTGNLPLIIDHTASSCGCTTAEYPKKPIAPGQKKKIVVRYNTSKAGSFQKTIVVVSNATNNPRTVLKIKGNVISSR